MLTPLALLLVSQLAGPPAGQPRVAEIPHGLVSFEESVPVPASAPGRLVAVQARDGAEIDAEQLLAQIDDREAQAARDAAQIELQSARLKAENDIEVQYAEAAYRLAEIEHAKAVEINSIRPDTVPASEVRRLELAKHRARLYIDKAALEQEVAKMAAELRGVDLRAAEEALARRQITSPLAGVVIAVLKQPGEWVDAGQPVMQVGRMDRLRVEGRLNGAEFDPAEVEGRPVRVIAPLARGRTETLHGRLVLVSPVAQAGNMYRVRAEVENRRENGQWILRPGMTVSLTIDTTGR